MIVSLNALGLSSIGTTAAYYFDTETSTNNSYVAGEVDFGLAGTPYSLIETAVSLMSGTTTTRDIKVILEVNSNPFWYHASSTDFGVDPDFCDTLSLKSFLEGVENYSGPLKNFLASATTTLNNWRFDIGTNVNSYNKICTFNFDFSGWQTRHNLPGFTSTGFGDNEKKANKIASKGFRLNKIYYDPAPDHGIDVDNEWVEIFNQTDSALDISNWAICDNTYCDPIPNTPPVPPLGYMLITASTSTELFWDFKDTMPVAIIADGKIGKGLDNTNDMVILKRPDGVIVDQMNYGPNPYVNWPNYNSGIWNPGADDVAQGITLARNPSGHDTDGPGDWRKLGVPTVNLTNPNQSGNQTWTWGSHRDIKWSASNQNGPDMDLSVDLYLIKDLDHSQTITSADSVTPIILGTENDGLYTWQVPSGFLGYIWIKIVVTGPENPMLNDMMVSGKVFDPFPMELWKASRLFVLKSINEAFSTSTLLNYVGEIYETSTSTVPVVPVGFEMQIEVGTTTGSIIEPAIEIGTTTETTINIEPATATTTGNMVGDTGTTTQEVAPEVTVEITPEIAVPTTPTVPETETTEISDQPLPIIETEPAIIRDPLLDTSPLEVEPIPEPAPEPTPEPESESAPI